MLKGECRLQRGAFCADMGGEKGDARGEMEVFFTCAAM